MRICKYCKKPISDNNVWNPDREGNGYHHACLCEMEFWSRDKQIYDKGRADALDKIRAEIETKYGPCDICEYFENYDYEENDISEYRPIGNIADILQIIDKYRDRAESEGEE